MSGEQLYQRYSEAYAQQLCIVDTWEELSDLDRRAWELMASNLPDMPSA